MNKNLDVRRLIILIIMQDENCMELFATAAKLFVWRF